MKRLDLTQAIHDALAAVARAERAFIPGLDSGSIIELPKLALADAVLAAVRAQSRIDRLPARANGIIQVELRRKRKRPA